MIAMIAILKYGFHQFQVSHQHDNGVRLKKKKHQTQNQVITQYPTTKLNKLSQKITYAEQPPQATHCHTRNQPNHSATHIYTTSTQQHCEPTTTELPNYVFAESVNPIILILFGTKFLMISLKNMDISLITFLLNYGLTFFRAIRCGG